jgi:hypothetical protein
VLQAWVLITGFVCCGRVAHRLFYDRCFGYFTEPVFPSCRVSPGTFLRR